jgi:branched-chain amino acid transport system substrate-binding protein
MIKRNMLAAAAALTTATFAHADVIKVGVITPLSGPCAQYGIPITRGAELWADQLNKAGGIADASGNKHTVEVHAYDNKCYTPGDELASARRAVQDDGVQFLLQTWTPAARKAIASFVTEKKVLTTTYGGGYLSKQFPYLIGSITGAPANYMHVAASIVEQHPAVKKVAILVADASYGHTAAAYFKAGLAPYKDRIQIVYDTPYDIAMASDIMGIVTPVAAAQPDLVLELGFPPGQQALMVEAMQQLGYQGLFGSEGWSLKSLLERLPPDYLANRLFSAYAIDAQLKGQNERLDALYAEYSKKYGEADWTYLTSATYASMATLEPGIKAAKTPDGASVLAALKSGPTVEHPIFGTSPWGGMDIYGVDNLLTTPMPIYQTDETGKAIKRAETVDTAAWWKKNKSSALPVLQSAGQVTND